MRFLIFLWCCAVAMFGAEAAKGATALIEFAKIPKDASLGFEGRDIALLRHPAKADTYYHLSALHVKVGDSVAQGDVIGLSGASVRVSGPHLH